MSIQELSNLISSSITFKTITPMIPVMFYFLGTQTKYQDIKETIENKITFSYACLLYTSPSPRDATLSRMPSSA